MAISIDRIRDAAVVIDPAFRETPQFLAETLSERLGLSLVLKVECVNPIRSFKGRGTDYLMHRIGSRPKGFACASAGNFGQGMAYAARKRGQRLTVFAAVTANPLKVSRMRALGAEVVLAGADFDAAKAAAKEHAQGSGALYIEDGQLPEIAEGAGTIALELSRMDKAFDAIFVPLGNGALINGIRHVVQARLSGNRRHRSVRRRRAFDGALMARRQAGEHRVDGDHRGWDRRPGPGPRSSGRHARHCR
jgi:threonine dehydratase